MKNLISILIVLSLALVSWTARSGDQLHGNKTGTVNAGSHITDDVTATETEKNVMETAVLPLPQETMEFSFLSGAGAWRTVLTLSADGSFSGEYLDSEMGDIGEGYPNGSAYVCDFSGKFENIEKIDEYSYKMTLSEVKTEQSVGEEWIEDEIRYVASEPYGIEEGTDFILYLPATRIDEVPEYFLTWWPYRYDQNTNPKETLSCYGILNVATEYGFFHAE